MTATGVVIHAAPAVMVPIGGPSPHLPKQPTTPSPLWSPFPPTLHHRPSTSDRDATATGRASHSR